MQILPAGPASKAMMMACAVAERVRKPLDVERAASIAYAQSSLPIKLGWQPASVAMGYAGLALLFGQLERCRPGEGWELEASNCLELAVNECEDAGPGLFGGLAGVALTGWLLSENGQRYKRLLANLDDALLRDLPAHVDRVNGASSGMPFGAFDLVSGLTGVAAYLLLRLDQPGYREPLVSVLEALMRLWETVDGRPRWHTPSSFVDQDQKRQRQFPHGNLNCGLAHGIPGPLAVLSLASLAGVAAGPAMQDTIDSMAAWLESHRADDAWGLNWPNVIAIVANGRGYALRDEASPTHNAWCYGSPGVANALRLAGKALGVDRYGDVAEDALRAIVRRPPVERGIVAPTFCHGLAGLMHIFVRFAQSAHGQEFADEAQRIFCEIEDMFEPDSLLGFRTFEFRGQRVDQPGLLDGAPGVALAFLAAATSVEPSWDRLFLLS